MSSMEVVGCRAGRIVDAVVFLEYFRELPDGRQSAKVKYPLDEVLLLCLLAVIAGAEAITDIARFGEKKLTCCGASGRFGRGRRRTITWATSSPPWIPRRSNAAS